MELIHSLEDLFHKDIKCDTFWNHGDAPELLMHKVHAYPAKFPAFLTSKIVGYLEASSNKKIQSMADPFCGCGTAALEAKVLGIDFVGYDINPVATLIAKTKTQKYCNKKLMRYYDTIIKNVKDYNDGSIKDRILLNPRIQYWFDFDTTKALCSLYKNVNKIIPPGKYRDFFLTAFSNILKACSRWLTKSIKPQIDPNKAKVEPLKAFKKQFAFMQKANDEMTSLQLLRSHTAIHTKNILKISPKKPLVDLVVTSPPYVTSYDYADLHQLSTLWLGYTEDYRTLRQGTIGSLHREIKDLSLKTMNITGKMICQKLSEVASPAQTKSVKNYFLDISQALKHTGKLLHVGGNLAIVIGNTTYKGVKVDNTKFLINELINQGFTDIQLVKRKIGVKRLTPYRDEIGRFTSNKNGRKIYSHEYLVIARKQ